MKTALPALAWALSLSAAAAPCLPTVDLIERDRQYEEALRVGADTVVLRGLSTVEQWNADGKTWRSNRYQFMRTYIGVGGQCKLLSVQTMKVWSSPAGG